MLRSDASAPSQQAKGWSLRSGVSAQALSAAFDVGPEYHKLECSVAQRGPTHREVLVTLWSRSSWGCERIGFSHSNYPSCPQFRSVTFFESSLTEMLFYLGWYLGTKNKFTRLFIKNRSSLDRTDSWDQTMFEKFEELSPGALCPRQGSNKHFWDYNAAQGGKGQRGASPHYMFVLWIDLNTEEQTKLSFHE